MHEQAIDLRFDLRNALQRLGESERIFTLLREAETLAETIGDSRRLAQASSYMTTLLLMRGDYGRALAAGQRACALVASLGDIALHIQAHAYLGQINYTLGDYQQARQVLRQAMAFPAGEESREGWAPCDMPAVFCRTLLARCLAQVGAFAEGAPLVQRQCGSPRSSSTHSA